MFSVDEKLKMEFLAYIKEKYRSEDKSVSDYVIISEYVLKHMDKFEDLRNASVYNFNKDRLLALLGSFDSGEVSTLATYKSIIRYYLIHVSDRTSGVGIANLEQIGTEDIKSVTNKYKRNRKYMTKTEYLNFLNLCNDKLNPQDAVIFVLLYRGVKGKGYEDLRNLKTTAYDHRNHRLNVGSKIVQLEDIENEIMYKSIASDIYVKYVQREVVIKTRVNKVTGEVIEVLPKGKQPVNQLELNINSSNIVKATTVDSDDDVESLYNIKLRLLNSLKHIDNRFISGSSVYSSGIIYDMLASNDFHELRHKEMVAYLEDNRIKLSRAKLSEMQGIMMDKLYDEGIEVTPLADISINE